MSRYLVNNSVVVVKETGEIGLVCRSLGMIYLVVIGEILSQDTGKAVGHTCRYCKENELTKIGDL